MTQQSYSENSEEATSSTSSGKNSASTSPANVYALPFSIGQKEIVVNDVDRTPVAYESSNALANGANVSIIDSTEVSVGDRTYFNSDVTIYQYIDGRTLPEIENGAVGQNEVHCNKNVRVASLPPPPASPIDKQNTSGSGLFKRHFNVIMILLTTATIICAATLVTLRLVGSKKPSFVPTTIITTADEPTTTTISPSKIHYSFNKTQWGGRELPNPEPMNQPVKLVIVKHTKTNSCQDVPSCFRDMQDLQNTDVGENHLQDIRYNFVIGGEGNIYEGRGWGVRNSQMNNTIDIGFMGDFNVQMPSEWVVGAGKHLVVMGMDNGHLDPTGTIVVCHNQTEETDSPGDYLFKEVVQWDYYSDEIINGSSYG